MKALMFALTLTCMGAAMAAPVTPGTYKGVDHCRGQYLPDDNSTALYKMAAWDGEIDQMVVTVNADSIELDYAIQHQGGARTQGVVESKLLSTRYRKVIKQGPLLSGTYYSWEIWAPAAGKLTIDYNSLVVFLGLPTATHNVCQLELVQ